MVFISDLFRHISDLWDRVCSILAVLAHGLGQLTRDVESDVSTLNFRNDVTFAPQRKTPNGVRQRLLCDVKCQK